MVPNGWRISKLGDVINYKKGYAFNSSFYQDDGTRIIRISDTSRNSIHSLNPVFINNADAKNLESYKLFENDIIVSTVGSRPHLLDSMVGKAVKIPKEVEGSLLNQNLVKIIPKETEIDNFYLYEMVKNSRFIFYISTLIRGNANQVSITLSELFEYEFLLPPIQEQKKIAEILSTWDKAIETVEKLVANSQQQKKALMQHLLTGQKRLLDENGVKFGDEWEKTNLKNLLKEEKARNRDKAITRVLSVTNHSGFVLPENHFSKRVASDEVSNYKVVKKGQFGYNPSRINVGSFARLDDFDSGILSPMYVVFEISTPKLDSDFFNFWMQSHEAKQRINNSTQGSVRDSVGFDAMASFPFKLPTIKEQEKIAQVLTLADREIDLYNQQLDKLKLEKKSLMQQLLTGQKRVIID